MGVQARLVRRVFGPECTGQGLIPKPYALSQWHVCFSFSLLEGTNQGSVHVKTDGTEIRLPLSTPLAVLPLPSLSRLPRNFLRNLCDLHSHLLSLNPVLIPPSTFPQLCQSAFFDFPPPVSRSIFAFPPTPSLVQLFLQLFSSLLITFPSTVSHVNPPIYPHTYLPPIHCTSFQRSLDLSSAFFSSLPSPSHLAHLLIPLCSLLMQED